MAYNRWLSSEELYHSGRLGQKWGVRNGPPYPLSRQKGDAQIRKQYGGASVSREERRDPTSEHYSDKKIRIAKNVASATLAVAAPAAVAAITASTTGIMMIPPQLIVESAALLATPAYNSARAMAAKAVTAKYKKERENHPIDSKTGFHLKEGDMSQRDDLKRVNPGWGNFDENTKQNCMLCTTTYDLRRRGYDVTSKTAGVGFSDASVKSWYPKAEIKIVGDRNRRAAAKKLVKELTTYDDGARGNLMITWKGMKGGHSVVWEKTGGKVKILDAQSNEIFNNPYRFLSKTEGVYRYARLDDVKFDKKAIKRCSQ